MTTTVVETVLTWPEPVEELEQAWRAREAVRRWEASDETCLRLLEWLRRPAETT